MVIRRHQALLPVNMVPRLDKKGASVRSEPANLLVATTIVMDTQGVTHMHMESPQSPGAISLEAMTVPRHVAIFIDGNGRWASSRGLPRPQGHVRGFEVWVDFSFIALEMNIEFLTFYLLSQDNFKRPKDEVSNILNLWKRYLREVVPRLRERNVRFIFSGDPGFFDDETVRYIEEGQNSTESNTGMTLTVSAAYGGRWDIVTAVRKFLASTAKSGAEITEEDITRNLSTRFSPDPDLVIRPGGEQRLSNCWVWQIAQSELYFTETLWPDFQKGDLIEAIRAYQKRERRRGNIGVTNRP